MELWADDRDGWNGDEDAGAIGGLQSYPCAFCGEPNEVFVDRTAAKRQQFTEDCEVCCRPNLLTIFTDPDARITIQAEQEYAA